MSHRHLSFYRFVPIEDPSALRAELLAFCRARGLLGTVLLAREGVNAMVCGEASVVGAFREEMERRFGPGLPFRETRSDPESAFSRLLVKVKAELVPVGEAGLSPAVRTAPRLCPAELKRRLDAGEPLVLLDARNDYEVKVGTFRGAESLGLESSRHFASRARERAAAWRGKTVVSFCTGGIRCEKASAVLLGLGLDAFQLDGGILRYFEETGGAHFEGKCFVFDGREAVDGSLSPSPRGSDPAAEYGRHRRKNQRA